MPLTDAQIDEIAELDAKHARERGKLAGRQANEREALQAEHRAELAELAARIDGAAGGRAAGNTGFEGAAAGRRRG